MLYVPSAFRETDVTTLHAFIAAHAFATLISPGADDPPVSHLPLLLEETRGELGTLTGHMARANPHWRQLESNPLALALFHGPHAYVSPGWYGHHPSVPTWNYATVHVRGKARVTHSAEELETIVRRLVAQYEDPRPQPWRMDLPAGYKSRMLGGIVGFEITITEMTGKFKLSQNRPATDRPRVVQALAAGSPGEQAVAALMRERYGVDGEA